MYYLIKLCKEKIREEREKDDTRFFIPNDSYLKRENLFHFMLKI